MRERPVYCCRNVPDPPPLDGKIPGTVWESADKVNRAFHLLGTEADPPGYFLEAAALWDEEALYVCIVSDPSPVPVTMRQRDQDLFNECAVEVFLRAGGGYYEIEVNPRGAVLDLYFPDEGETDWRKMAEYDVPGLVWSASEVDANGRWCAQLAIPWAGVPDVSGAQHEGTACVFANFTRSQKLPDGSYHLTTWGPARNAFCELANMGCVVLLPLEQADQ
jgi:hypothetical protein